MKFIVYISHTEKSWSAEDISNLAKDSAQRNEKKGLTGILVYRPQKNRSSGDFLQVIEGKSEDVDVIFKKILKDRRHNSIFIVSEGEIESRTFNDWFMGVMDLGFATSARRCCTTLTREDSHCESMRLDGAHEQAIPRPLPHDELVQLHCFAAQARVPVDMVGQGADLARAA